MDLKVYSIEDVASCNIESNCWIIIHEKVFNVTSFLNEHPGGKKIMLKVAGQDASKQFDNFHDQSILKEFESKLCIGKVNKQDDKSKDQNIREDNNGNVGFGDMVPFGDPMWYQDFESPYYSEVHIRVRKEMRKFVTESLMPYCSYWEESKKIPSSVYQICAEKGILAALCGKDLPKNYYNGRIIGGIKPEEVDPFVEMIIMDEMCRCGSGSVLWTLMGGFGIGLPPVMKFADEQLRSRIVPNCIKGDKVICLAITEPSAGSDVANLKCAAIKTQDGKHYIVNGEKKWITNGVFADYFTVAVRTGGDGIKGISLLLIERTMPGIKIRQMKCSGVWASGTAFIVFEDIKVPASNLIGKENQGFKPIMYNFNSERMGIAIQANRFARICYEEALKYSHKRETFGTKLVNHPVIRNKFAHMARKIEATHAWIEALVYQTCIMPKKMQMARLGGPIALLKAQSTQTFEFCAREAAQIFGGLAYTIGGQGGKVERLYREVRAYAIPGGSEEIMLDLGMRQSIKVAKALNGKF